MKVQLFTNNFLPRVSGVAVAVNFLNTALNKMGHRTLVVAPDYGFGHAQKGVEVFRVRSLYLTGKKVAFPLANVEEDAIREVTNNFKPDLIHSHHPFGLGSAAMSMADELSVPLVYTFHTLYDFFTHYFLFDTETVRKAVRDYVSRYANRCDLVIAPTEPIKQYLVDQGVTTRIEAVPTGIDISRFEKSTRQDIDRLKGDFGLEGYDAVLLYVGRISKEKNVALAFHALKELVNRGRNYALLYIGDGAELRALAKDAEELGIGDRVVWGGFLDQDSLALAYFAGDVFLFPSLSDTQGIVLYEARAAGLPVVATESMASKAVVKPGKNGMFAKNDATDFADKIQYVLDHPDEFNERFDAHAFSHEGLGKTYDGYYNELKREGRRRDLQESSALARLFEDIKSLI